jgi:hypothetical protein
LAMSLKVIAERGNGSIKVTRKRKPASSTLQKVPLRMAVV